MERILIEQKLERVKRKQEKLAGRDAGYQHLQIPKNKKSIKRRTVHQARATQGPENSVSILDFNIYINRRKMLTVRYLKTPFHDIFLFHKLGTPNPL